MKFHIWIARKSLLHLTSESWFDAMNVNHDAPLDDVPDEVDDIDEHIEMEELLVNGQCNDIIM